MSWYLLGPSIKSIVIVFRGGSRNVATSKMERFVIVVTGFQPLTIITKRSILDVAAVLDPPLVFNVTNSFCYNAVFYLKSFVMI